MSPLFLPFQAIQEIMSLQPDHGDHHELEQRRREEVDGLKQRCHDLEHRIQILEEEKSNLMSECEQLQTKNPHQRSSSESKDDVNLNKELKKQLEAAQEALFKSDSQRDDLQTKVELMEKQLEDGKNKDGELQKMTEQAVKLKVSNFIDL